MLINLKSQYASYFVTIATLVFCLLMGASALAQTALDDKGSSKGKLAIPVLSITQSKKAIGANIRFDLALVGSSDPACLAFLDISAMRFPLGKEIALSRRKRVTIGPADFSRGTLSNINIDAIPYEELGAAKNKTAARRKLVRNIWARFGIDCSRMLSSSGIRFSKSQKISFSSRAFGRSTDEIEVNQFLNQLAARLGATYDQALKQFTPASTPTPIAEGAPIFLTQLQSKNFSSNEEVVLEISASGSQPLTFEWQFLKTLGGRVQIIKKKKGISIVSSSNSSTLIIRSSIINTLNYQGYFRVKIKNSFGIALGELSKIDIHNSKATAISTPKITPVVPTVTGVPEATSTISPTIAPSPTIAATSSATATPQPDNGIVPADRRINWAPGVNVGVPGGIERFISGPNARTKCATTACQALDNAPTSFRDGTNDATTLIQDAISSAAQNTYVNIPAGVWRTSSNLKFGADRDYITLRGAGMEATKIQCHGSYTCLSVGSSSDWNWGWPSSNNNVTAGKTKGSTQITIPDTSQFSVGQIINIASADEVNSTTQIISGWNYARKQLARVINKSGNTLTFHPPLYHDYSNVEMRVFVAQAQVDFVGIEDLTFDASKGSITFGIWMEQSYASWLKNVRVLKTNNYLVFMDRSLNLEMRHSALEELNHEGSNGAGLLMQTSSACLIEDNIIRESFPNIEVNHGASGNVFSYNFINNSNGLIGIDTNHGPHNQFNLYEGNLAHNLMSDGYFGSNSHDTIFRNWFTGLGLGTPNTPTYCFSLKRFTRQFSVIGNILGKLGDNYNCTAYGQPNIGNGGWSGTAQPSAGDWWEDLDQNGSTIRGSLTARADNFHGTITLTSGKLTFDQAPFLFWNNDGNSMAAIVRAVNGNQIEIDSSPWAVTLPPVNTVFSRIWPGAGGFQELDLDVEASTLKKGNYYPQTGIPAAESLGDLSLPDSLYHITKPTWFGSLAWPPFNPKAPAFSYDALPAAYRFMHPGQNTPGT